MLGIDYFNVQIFYLCFLHVGDWLFQCSNLLPVFSTCWELTISMFKSFTCVFYMLGIDYFNVQIFYLCFLHVVDWLFQCSNLLPVFSTCWGIGARGEETASYNWSASNGNLNTAVNLEELNAKMFYLSHYPIALWTVLILTLKNTVRMPLQCLEGRVW